MSKPFDIKSPASQLAAELRRRIRAGEIAGRMPGLRKIMADFALSRRVVEDALAELLQAGDVGDRGPSKAMIPVRRAPERDDSGTLIVYDLPVERRGGDQREFFLAMESALPAPVLRLSLDSHETTPEKVAERVMESPCSRIVIMDHRGETAGLLAAAGRTVVSAGTAGSAPGVSQIGVPHETLVKGALRRAFAAGHRRVSFPLWRRKPEVAELMRRWIAETYAEAGYRHAREFDAPVVADRSPEALHTCLRELLRHTPPTALIASDFQQWLATTLILAERGLRTPADVSLITLCAAPEWSASPVSQAHFKHPVPALVKALRRALADTAKGLPAKPVRIEPEWVAGDSLAPPAR